MSKVLSNDEIDTYDDPWQNHIHILHVRKSKWKKVSNCYVDFSVGKMFPPKAEMQLEVAKKVCMGCPTQVECLNFALVSKEEFGVWGGTTEVQRKKLHKTIIADGFGNFKSEWNTQMEEYIYALSQFLVKAINEEKILLQTQT